ncbi:hypothetical protein SEUBUCD646_0P00160 [Saccharomyces eubayanus]|nr:hypothetical protein SEUBUCD646_0P00160 [Saccharomyces eubayanus]
MSFAKQACDCCRVRRVKCNREEPCNRCLQHDLKCTYLRLLKKRGPKSIRTRSLEKIANMQKVSEENSTMAAPKASVKVPKVLIDQCLRLYNDNLYVIWPLLCYNDLHKLLDEKYDNCSIYWFLVALSAATLSNLQTGIETKEGDFYTGKQLCSLCMSSRQDFDDLSSSDLLRIMTYYCLHRCFAYFSDTITSYRLYCEAIGLIKIARFHCEETYKPLSFNEQQLGRKVYYLLLLTERYYSVYIHCATSLDVTISPPQPEAVTDPRLSLDSFLEVIGVFTVPEKCFFDALATGPADNSCTEDSLKRIWNQLHTVSPDVEPWSTGTWTFHFRGIGSEHWLGS